MGKDFKGVVNLRTREAILFEGARHGTQQAEKRRVPFAEVRDIIGDKEFERLEEELDLVEMAGDPYDQEAFLEGKVSPVFWGSALSNFGVEPLLEFLADFTAPPKATTHSRALKSSPLKINLRASF